MTTHSHAMNDVSFAPIGYMKTCFAEKNGTPRQPSVSSVSRGRLTISKSIFNNPDHSIEGLIEFSHVWILFVFHLNAEKSVKAKVKPPRLNGAKTGVFSTRSPHRPNPIGLTLAKLESVENYTLYFSGIDIVNDTPVLDIKPYIADYDKPESLVVTLPNSDSQSVSKSTKVCDNTKSLTDDELPRTTCERSFVKDEDSCGSSFSSNENSSLVADWIQRPPISDLTTAFSNRAQSNIAKFKAASSDGSSENDWHLSHIDPGELEQAITDVLKADPRSNYRRKKCSDRLYYFTIDNAHVTAWFDETTTPHCAEVIRIVPKKFINLWL